MIVSFRLEPEVQEPEGSEHGCVLTPEEGWIAIAKPACCSEEGHGNQHESNHANDCHCGMVASIEEVTWRALLVRSGSRKDTHEGIDFKAHGQTRQNGLSKKTVAFLGSSTGPSPGVMHCHVTASIEAENGCCAPH